MSLTSQKFLFIDCQTTGMHPSIGQILELAWCWTSADSAAEPLIHSALFELEGESKIPKRVQEITGLRDEDLRAALSAQKIREIFLNDLKTFSEPLQAIIHYAQFEKPFVEKFLFSELRGQLLPFEVFCSHAISKRLFPRVPSRNIRALSGYFGADLGEVKRAAHHVRATIEIWKGLSRELSARAIDSSAELRSWLQTKPTKTEAKSKTKKTDKYEYLIAREKRLQLPDAPGVYRMIAKSGKILYVGKATCLKERVNSYFRGKRGRDARKLEMMAQVWDLEVTECSSAMEAALLETDEIKKYDPPYNVSLKAGNRQFAFYSRDFLSASPRPDAIHSVGPFRRFNAVEDVQLLSRWLLHGDPSGLFYNLIELRDLEAGYRVFRKRLGFDVRHLSVRSHLALGYKLWRQTRTTVEVTKEATPESDLATAELLTPDEIADKFERLYIRAAQAAQRSKTINRLLNARIKWHEGNKLCELEVRDGQISKPTTRLSQTSAAAPPAEPIWSSLTMADYDRMSILYSESRARSAEILFLEP